MAVALEYENRHNEGLEKSEISSAGRLVFTLAKRMDPKRYIIAEGVSRYVRILDDFVDEADPIRPAIRLIQSERSGLFGMDRTSMQQKYLSPSFDCLTHNQQVVILRMLSLVLTGFEMDATVRLTQKALTERQLITRSYYDVWPTLVCFGVGWAHVVPRLTKRILMLMNAWCAYDNLRDLTEDLKHGLVLISQEELDRLALRFKDGDKLPNTTLQNYYNTKKHQVAEDLRSYTDSIFNLGLPTWISVPSFIYFYTRPFKLLKPLTVEEGAVFKAPMDSLLQSNYS